MAPAIEARSSRAVHGVRRGFRDIGHPHTSQRRPTPASSSPKASAALIESAATMSRPKSPLRKLATISNRRVSNTGNVQPPRPDEARPFRLSPEWKKGQAEKRDRSPGNRTRSGRRRMPRTANSASSTPTYPSHLGANLPEDAIHPLNLADGCGYVFLIGSSLRPSVRQRAHPARQRILSITRRRGPSGSQQPQSLRGQQLDAIQIHQAHLSDLYMQNDSPPRRNRIGFPRRRERSI